MAHVESQTLHAGGEVPPVCAICEGSDLQGDGDVISVMRAGDRSRAKPPREESEVDSRSSGGGVGMMRPSRAHSRSRSSGAAEAHEPGDANCASQDDASYLGRGLDEEEQLAPRDRDALVGGLVDPITSRRVHALGRTGGGSIDSSECESRVKRSRVRMPLSTPVFYGGAASELSDRERAAAHFLGFIFGRLRSRWKRRPFERWPAVWRPVVDCRCGYGLTLASREEFGRQAAPG